MNKSWLFRIAILAVAAGAVFVAWRSLTPEGLPDGFASSNGRIEATEIDVAAKTPGLVAEILAHEGDVVTTGQVLARMDTAVLEAQRREAEAALARARIGIETAKSVVKQREAERAATLAEVGQREAELDAAQRRLAHSEELAPRGSVPLQRLDDDRAQFQAAKAAVSAASASGGRGGRHWISQIPGDRRAGSGRGSPGHHRARSGGHRRQQSEVAAGRARQVSRRRARPRCSRPAAWC